MLAKWAVRVLVALGLILGAAASVFMGSGWASRNSSGTYTLGAGNPVVSGTPISSTNENAFRSDVAAEFTDSLSRSGKGAMTAPLRVPNGTVAAPSVTFDSDQDNGLYRIGANDIGFAVAGAKAWECTSTGCTFPLLLAVTGAQTNAAGITVTQSTSNGNGVASTGNGTGKGVMGTGGATGVGVYGVGGATSGVGVYGTGSAGNSAGVQGAGQGSAAGVSGTGGATGVGVFGTGGATSGSGGYFQGQAGNSIGAEGHGVGTEYGLYGVGGGTSGGGVKGLGGAPNGTGGVFDGSGTGKGITVGTGYAFFNGGNPATSTGFSNTLTQLNIPKAWARLNPNGGSATTVESGAGFNVTNPQESGNTIIIDFTTDFTSTPACVVQQESATASRIISFTSVTTSAATIQGFDASGGGSAINLGASTIILNIVCFGAN